MAKILICAGSRGWSTENVILGIKPYINHDIEVCYFWINGYEPSDWDLIYFHSGAVVNGMAKDYIRQHRNDTKWVVGIRGPTAYKRNFHTLSSELWDGYSAGSEWYMNACRGDELVPGFVCHGSIDTTLFKPLPLPDDFKIGWAGRPASGTKRFQRFLDLPFDKHIASPSGGYNRRIYNVETISYSYEKMPEFYKQISVYVNTSFREGGPLPPKEAGACGRPSVVTNTGDASEWIPKDYVFSNKSREFDSEGMIDKIEKLKYNKELLEREGLRFCKLAQRFDHSVVAKQYQLMFDEVL